MNGAQALVASIKSYGVDTIFALPGAQLYDMMHCLHEDRQSIRIFHTRHEQAAAYMAFGYAQSTGRVGTCLVVPGPGLLNTSAALSTAYACNQPVLCLTGQLPTHLIGQGLGVLHEIPDQLGAMKSVSKWTGGAAHPTQVPTQIREAFRQLHTGRRRPVVFEMAPDVMSTRTEVELLDAVDDYQHPSVDLESIEKAAELLGKAKNPGIFVGGGIFGAEEALLELARMLQAPVVMSSAALGAIDARDPLAHTSLSGAELWPDMDVVLAVGTRFILRFGWGSRTDRKVIRVDIDPTQATKPQQPEIRIVGDAHDALSQLVEHTRAHNIKRVSREDELTAAKARAQAKVTALEPQTGYATAIRRALPEDGFLVVDITQMAYYSWYGFPIYQPRTYIHSGYQGTLGHAYATALGVKAAHPDRQVVSISGDGGFMFNVQELATAAHFGIGVVAIVFNDNAFGNVKQAMIDDYDGHDIGTDLTNPDFVKLAESFGIMGVRAESADALEKAITDAFKAGGPALIEVPVSDMPNVWKIMPPGRMSSR